MNLKDWRHAVLGILLGGLAFLIFLPSLQFRFVNWDDNLAIYSNPLVRNLDLAALGHMFTNVSQTCRYMPLCYLAWGILYRFFEFDPHPYHLMNVLFHAASAVLLFYVLRKFLQIIQGASTRAIDIACAIGTALWAVHPLRAEVVARASDFTYCSSTTFFLLATLLYLQAKQDSSASHPSYRKPLYWAAYVALMVSFLFFPVAIAILPLLILVDIYPLKILPLDPRKWLKPELRHLWIEKIPIFACSVLFGSASLLAELFPQGTWLMLPKLGEAGIALRLARSAFVSIYYLWIQIFPIDLLPANPLMHGITVTDWPFLGAMVLVALISVVAFLFRKIYPGLLIAWCAHIILVGPTMLLAENRLPFPCDRYAQIDSMLLALVLAQLGHVLWCKLELSKRWVVTACSVTLIIAYATMTLPQEMIWKDSISLFEYTYQKLEQHPYRYDIQMRLGNAYVEIGAVDEAIPHLESVFKRFPHEVIVLKVLGYAYEMKQDWNQAVNLYERAAREIPGQDFDKALASAKTHLGLAENTK